MHTKKEEMGMTGNVHEDYVYYVSLRKGEIKMKYKIGDKVRLFNSEKEVEIVDIEDGVLADMYGTIISAYKINESNKLFVDIYDGTISEI